MIGRWIFSSLRIVRNNLFLWLSIIKRQFQPKQIRQINLDLKKIIYIGHSYHNKTKSTLFLLDYLRLFFDVEVILDDSWNGGSYPDLSFIDNSYLAVIFFQNLPDASKLKQVKNDNLIFFPMYDSVFGLTRSWWYNYHNLKIINFSKKLHEQLLGWKFESMYIQYFPKPAEFNPGNPNKVFFWQRMNNLNIKTILKLFNSEDLNIHIHSAVDPNHHFYLPTIEEEKRFNITFSDWFETKEDLLKVIKKNGIYIASREYEGIGISFLEAMAMGKVVIANNRPTMNEYITNGKTGYLFNINKPKIIDLTAVNKVQKAAYDYIKEGHVNWEKQKHTIIEFILKN